MSKGPCSQKRCSASTVSSLPAHPDSAGVCFDAVTCLVLLPVCIHCPCPVLIPSQLLLYPLTNASLLLSALCKVFRLALPLPSGAVAWAVPWPDKLLAISVFFHFWTAATHTSSEPLSLNHPPRNSLRGSLPACCCSIWT